MTASLADLFLLDPAVTFLNHGSYGACPREVFAEYQRWQMQLERQPVAFLDPARGLTGWMRAARQAVADRVGADADDLVGQTNATTALNLVAQSLDLAPGDEILTTDHEYAALQKTWAHVCRQTGAVLRAVRVPLPLTRAADFTEALLQGFTDRTRVLFLSHVTSATALHFPIADSVAEARRRGILTVIDGAHAPGLVPLDLNALGADFYAGNCHKWLLAPKGSAFLHVRRERQAMITPLVISHGWTPDFAEQGARGVYGNSPFIDALEMQGTRDPSAWLTVPKALEFARAHDWPKVTARAAALATETAARVAAMTGLPGFASADFLAPQMVAMPVPACDTAALHRDLIDRFGIEIPCYDWQGQSIVRLSVQGYNNPGHMDRLIAALRELIPGLSGE